MAKLKWAEDPDPDDADEDDIAEFEKIRKASLVSSFTVTISIETASGSTVILRFYSFH